MVVQTFPGFPFFKQAEMVFVMDIAKDIVVFAAFFFAHRFNQRKKGLCDLQVFVRKCIHVNSDNNHNDTLFCLCLAVFAKRDGLNDSGILILSRFQALTGTPMNFMTKKIQQASCHGLSLF